MNNKIVIVGAGSIGKAIEHLLLARNIQPHLWDKDPAKVESQSELSTIIPEAKAIFVCVPSWCLREAINKVKPYVRQATIIIGLSKGLEEKTLLRIDQLVAELLPDNPFVLLSGPMLAREIREDKRSYASATAASTNQTALRYVEQLFVDTRLSLDTSTDLKSVALAGVLKNVYTIVLGIADALSCGNNTKGWLVYLIVREMQLLAKRLDCDSEVMLGVAGLADLIATGFSPSSNNHRVGRELALHGQTDLKSEGFISLPSLIKLINGDTESLPLLHLLKQMLGQQSQTASIFESWLKQHPKA